MARAFCFDLDGTLMDSEVIWVEVVDEFMRSIDGSVTRAEVMRIVYGKSWNDTYADIRARLPQVEASLPDLTERMDARYHTLMKRRDVRIEGSVRLLKILANDCPVCVVSGSTRSAVAEAVVMLGIAGDLRFFLSTEDSRRGKPDPACYRMAVERLGVPAGECAAFEDSEAGMKAARVAGLYCVALARPGAPVQDTSSAHRVVTDLGLLDPAELLKCRAEDGLR